jgi:DNA-directed RNA polymerase specialized sigma24 family protein
VDDDLKNSLDEVLRFIPWKARQLAGKYGFRYDEKEDIEQELRLACLKRSSCFDPTRSKPHTFMRLVVNHRVAALIESQKAQCRDYRLRRSLEDSCDGTDRTFSGLADFVFSQNQRQWTRFEYNQHRQLDIQRAVTNLPPLLRHICRLLIAIDDVSLVAAAAGISRATLYRRIQQIRQRFIEAKLQDYQ